ncbi:hypothetical protein E1263_41500 [Kribbella antibiotica]|uniref:PH domain-containing protein n=1 Tax=Kribbella antibiotica TaxID=190195 RepID=A0A4R4YI83_9ACTN|nr:hypothetical protein [Kribbella antibiotica]TDD43679.1 hypothetical protein E1263_41500 [Kribbella antibiotica]
MVMGDTGPDRWDDEYRRTGRVFFRRRRRALLSRQYLISWAITIVPAIGTFDDWDSRGTWFYIRVVGIALLLASAVHTTAQILRGAPALIVDTTGIHLGKGFVPWSAIATIGPPTSTFWNDRLPIHLTDEDEDAVEIPQDNVHDLPALTAWLTHLHTERHPGALSG